MPSKAHRLYRRTRISAPLDEVFAFFSRAENLNRITPPWLDFRILTPSPIAMAQGTRIRYSLKLHIVRLHWKSEITAWDPPHSFEDTQIQGPYKEWVHFHRFAAQEDCTLMEDAVVYRVPGGFLEPLIHFRFVRPRLEAIFAYRESKLHEILGAPDGFQKKSS